MSVLVDTSVWVNHFRQRNEVLANLLLLDQVLTHPMVVLELACGTPPSPRIQTLSEMDLLQNSSHASLREVRDLIEQEKLYGMGCGLVDLVLLSSTLLTPGARLWTMDMHLIRLANRFGVSFEILV